MTADTVRGEEATPVRLQQEMKELLTPFTFDYTGHSKFCQSFCRDFLNLTGFQFIDPIIQTDDFDDPALEVYKRKCPDLVLNAETGDQFGNLYYGTRHFKLYRIDLNSKNKATDGTDYLFYYDTTVASKEALEALRDPRTRDSVSTYEGGQFYLADFERCRIRGGVPVNHTGGSYKGISYNGIVWYEGSWRIFDLSPLAESSYKLYLWTYQKRNKQKRQFDLTCSTRLTRYTYGKTKEEIFHILTGVHQRVLRRFKEDNNSYHAIQLLEEAGIKSFLETKPSDIEKSAYINLLNDYGFFLSETRNRYMDAIPVLQKVIELAPQRQVAYLNLGDAYWKATFGPADPTKQEFQRLAIKQYQEYARLMKEKGIAGQLPARVQDILNSAKAK